MIGISITEAEEILLERIGALSGIDVVIDNMRLKDGKPYQPKAGSVFVKAFIDYSGSEQASMSSQTHVRNLGILSLQVFAPLNSGTLKTSSACDKIFNLLQGYNKNGLEVYLVHAPRRLNDANFYGVIMRAEFRVN